MFATGARSAAEIVLPEAEPWDAMTRLNEEFEAVGSYLSGHPLDGRRRALAEAGVTPWRSFEQAVRENGHRAGRLAGTVTGRRDRRGRTGNSYAFVSLSDPTGQYEAVVFSDVLAEAGAALEPGAAVIIRVEAELDGERVRLRVQQARALGEEPAGVALETARPVHLKVFIRDETPLDALSSRLAQCRSAGAGRDTVSVVVQDTTLRREVELEIASDFRLGAGTAGSIKAIAGVVAVEQGGAAQSPAVAADPAEAPARLSSVG
jgi:DNA polymerase-3 subunit alpha